MSHSPKNILHDLIKEAKKLGADAADAILFSGTDISVSCRMGKPEDLERSESTTLGLRVITGQKQAIVSSSDMDGNRLSELVQRAVSMANLAPEDPYTGLAKDELLAKEFPQLDLCDDSEPEISWLREQCLIAEDAALAVNGITNSEGASAGYSRGSVTLVTSHGFAHTYETSSSSISVSVLAGKGEAMERDYDFTAARHMSDIEKASTVGQRAAMRAVKRLGARKIDSGNVPVIFDPRVGKGLLSTFAAAANGAAIARKTSFLKDSMGKKIFPDDVIISDDPHIIRGLASKPFDAEGVGGKKHDIVKNGILNGWFLDTRSANQLDMESSGHATRGSSSPPSPSPTNLYMHAGENSPQELIADVKYGFYVTETFGMGVNIITGDYSQGACGFWIENGERSFPVSEVTIAGNLSDMFAAVIPANDLEMRYAINTPTLRIDNMMVAGR